MNINQFKEELDKKSISPTNEQLALFQRYFEILIEYNQKMNLTAITDKEEVYLKHFYDSLTLLFFHPLKEGCHLCDVGAGAGFPSIPIKIMRNDLNITIVDSLGKRIQFLNYLVNELGLKEVKPINSRAEDYATKHRETFDVVSARAVARLNVLSELCIPLVKENGHFIAMKGQTIEEELIEAKNAIKTLGCTLTKQESFELPYEGGLRNILVMTKISKTPQKYPRNYGQIKNKPL